MEKVGKYTCLFVLREKRELDWDSGSRGKTNGILNPWSSRALDDAWTIRDDDD